MAKITKRDEKGRPCEFKFIDKRVISVRIEGEEVNLFELGVGRTALRKVVTKNIAFHDRILEVLTDSDELGQAVVLLNNLYVQGERHAIHEKNVAAHEELSAALPARPIERLPLRQWDYFLKTVDILYSGKGETARIDLPQAKEAVLEALEAYTDREHPDHVMTRDYLLTVPAKDPLRVREDGLWILRDMIKRMAGQIPDEAQSKLLIREFRRQVRSLRRSLGNYFYEPMEYLNDVDSAEDWLEAAAASIQEGDVEGGLDFCVKALGAASNHLDAYYKMVECYILLNDYDGAIKTLEMLKFMPTGERIFKHRKDYYALYLHLIRRMPDEKQAAAHLLNIKALAKKYQIDLDNLKS